MYKFLIYFYNLDVKKAYSAVLMLAFLLSIPLVYALNVYGNQSRFYTSADYDDLIVRVDDEINPDLVRYPKEAPQVVNVAKYFARKGDSVLIYGNWFGKIQKDSQVLLNNQPIDKSDIRFWANNEIEFSVPANEGVFTVGVNINGKKANWEGKLNVFNDSTQESVKMKGNTIISNNPNLQIKTVSVKNLNLQNFKTNKQRVISLDEELYDTNSDIIDVQVGKNGKTIPFKVITE